TKARDLLKEAGVTDRDGDGVREDAAGRRLAFSLMVPTSSSTLVAVAEQIKASLEKDGVEMTVAPTEWPVMLDRVDKRNFEALMLGWTGGVETDPYQMFHSSNAEGHGDNYTSHRSEALDKLLD